MGLVMRLSVLCWSFLEFQVVSIHQTDAQLMERGIYGLGGFLKVAKDPERPVDRIMDSDQSGSCGALEGCISTEGSFECTWGAGGGPWSREIGETSERSPGMTGGMGNMVAVHRGFCGHCVFR